MSSTPHVHTHSRINMRTHSLSRTYTQKKFIGNVSFWRARIHTLKDKRTHTLSLSHPQIRKFLENVSFRLPPTCTRTHTQTHTNTLSLSLSHTHNHENSWRTSHFVYPTRAHIDTLKHTHTQTHTHSLSLSFSLTHTRKFMGNVSFRLPHT